MDQLKASKKAGKVNREAIQFGFEFAQPGVLMSDLDAALGQFIRDHEGCTPAFNGYKGFPANACLQRNEEIVHGVWKRGHKIKEGDVLTIDIGTKYDGWCTDAAETRIVGEPRDASHVRLIEGSREILAAAVAEVRDGVGYRQIAVACEKAAEKYQLNIFPNLGGHQIGREVHEGSTILHTTKGVDWPSLQMMRASVLREGQFICLEPIVTLGDTNFVTHRDGWTLKSKDGLYSAQQEVMLYVTESGHEVLS